MKMRLLKAMVAGLMMSLQVAVNAQTTCTAQPSRRERNAGVTIVTDPSCATLAGVGCLNTICRYCRLPNAVGYLNLLYCSEIQGSTTPAPTTVTPAPTTTTPRPTTVTPAPTTVAPAPTTVTPAPTTVTPAPTTTTPRPTTVAPPPTTVTPTPTTITPAPTTVTPAPTTVTPAPTTTTPRPTTVTPVPTTVTPAPTTVTPAPTTVTPAPTTITPAPTTVTPTPTTITPRPTTVTPPTTTVTPSPTVDDPAFVLTCSYQVSAGDSLAGIGVVNDVSCCLGGLGCVNDVCRLCSEQNTTAAAHLMACNSLAINNGDDITFVTIETIVDDSGLPGSSSSPTPTITMPTAAPIATPQPSTNAPSDPCVALVGTGDLNAGISAVSDTNCEFGGLGCFSPTCRYCMETSTTLSSHLMPCSSITPTALFMQTTRGSDQSLVRKHDPMDAPSWAIAAAASAITAMVLAAIMRVRSTRPRHSSEVNDTNETSETSETSETNEAHSENETSKTSETSVSPKVEPAFKSE